MSLLLYCVNVNGIFHSRVEAPARERRAETPFPPHYFVAVL